MKHRRSRSVLEALVGGLLLLGCGGGEDSSNPDQSGASGATGVEGAEGDCEDFVFANLEVVDLSSSSLQCAGAEEVVEEFFVNGQTGSPSEVPSQTLPSGFACDSALPGSGGTTPVTCEGESGATVEFAYKGSSDTASEGASGGLSQISSCADWLAADRETQRAFSSEATRFAAENGLPIPAKTLASFITGFCATPGEEFASLHEAVTTTVESLAP